MLQQDIKELEDYIVFLIEQSKKHTLTDMIMGNIPQSTVIGFNYSLKKKPLSINTDTLSKIVKRIDELEGKTNYHKKLCELIKRFIQKHIMIDSISYLTNEIGLNYTTLHKLSDFTLKTPYRLTTLKQYAEKINEKKGSDINECKNCK
ncbi:hypothetical protein [Staphylococcus aureus]|uniref:hypothetical protein n=1 Tax=Staphylococcus aureus TaxID=1280 RepID=UPI000DE2C6D2|nr:hypothetical protein [Staphylococcus aureus]